MSTPVSPRSRVPSTSLNAADANGNGGGVDVSGYQTIAMQVTHTGTPTGGTITLELSLNGDDWFATSTVFTIGTEDNGDILFSVDTPVLYARAVLAGLTGGSDPTVTALISGA